MGFSAIQAPEDGFAADGTTILSYYLTIFRVRTNALNPSVINIYTKILKYSLMRELRTSDIYMRDIITC